MADPQQVPTQKGIAQTAMEAPLAVYRDALGGTARMREAAERYLPRFEREEAAPYKRRLGEAVFFNATELTLDAMVGMVMSTDPELSADVPDEIREDWENIDLAGRHYAVFAKDLFRLAWDGMAAVFVDMQRVNPGEIRTRSDESRAGLRPFARVIEARNILRARSVLVNGKEVCGRFAFVECVTEPHGEFGEREEVRVRDYTLEMGGAPHVTFKVWAEREVEGKSQWVVIDEGILHVSASQPLGEIPVVPCYTNRAGFFSAVPPLLDLAHENIDHYQQRSEHRVAWKYARVPIPVFPGMDPEEIVVAADRGICSPSPDHKPYYLETAGASLEGSKEELRESERRMALLGASLLYNADRAVTATEKRIETGQSNSRLSSAARGLQDCLEEVARLFAAWRNIDMPERTDGRWVTVSRDFEKYLMGPQEIAALDAAVSNGHLRLETFLTALRDGVPVLSFMDPEAEAELLDGAEMQAPAPAPALPVAA